MVGKNVPTLLEILFPQIYEATESPPATTILAKNPSYVTIVIWDTSTKVNNTVVKGDSLDIDIVLTGSQYTPPYPPSDPITWKEVWIRVYNPDGSLLFEDWELSDDMGIATFRNVPLPSVEGTCSVVVSFPGTINYDPSESSLELLIESRIPILSLGVSPTSALPNTPIGWSGVLSDPKRTTYGIPDKDIILQESNDGINFTDVKGPVKTGADGSYSDSYILPSTSGTYYYRTRYPGGSENNHYQVAVSPTVEVTVEGEAIPPIPPPPEPPVIPPPNGTPPPLWCGIFPRLCRIYMEQKEKRGG